MMKIREEFSSLEKQKSSEYVLCKQTTTRSSIPVFSAKNLLESDKGSDEKDYAGSGHQYDDPGDGKYSNFLSS